MHLTYTYIPLQPELSARGVVQYLLCKSPVLLLLSGSAAMPLFGLALQVQVVALTVLTHRAS